MPVSLSNYVSNVCIINFASAFRNGLHGSSMFANGLFNGCFGMMLATGIIMFIWLKIIIWLASVGIMAAKLRVSLKPFNTIVLWWYEWFQGSPMIPKDASLSDSYVSDRCSIWKRLCFVVWNICFAIWNQVLSKSGEARKNDSYLITLKKTLQSMRELCQKDFTV